MNTSTLPYRPCVGVMLLNRHNKVFVGQRIDNTMEAWQMPQGGIDDGEDFEQTAFRELKEEIGTNNSEIISRSKDWLYYDLPNDIIGKVWGGKFRGQKQIWFLMRFLGQDSDIDLDYHHPEFKAWKWVDVADVPKLIVPFKRDLYQAIVKEFQPFLGD